MALGPCIGKKKKINYTQKSIETDITQMKQKLFPKVDKYIQLHENILINAGNSKRTYKKKPTKDGGMKNMEKEREIPLHEEFKK